MYEDVSEKLARIPSLIEHLWSGSGVSGILLITAVAFSLIWLKKQANIDKGKKEELLRILVIVAVLVLGAHVISAILFISPRRGEKLFFAPVTLIIIGAYMLLIWWGDLCKKCYIVLGTLAFAVNCYYFIIVVNIYGDYKKEFEFRMSAIEKQKRSGVKDVVIAPYNTKRSRLVWGDDLGRIRQGEMAMLRYLGVNSIRIDR